MTHRNKRILIDANPAILEVIGRYTGIGRTCKELILGLDAIADELPYEISLYSQNVKGCSAKHLNTRFKTIHSYLRNNHNGQQWGRRLRLRELLGRYDLQHITHNYDGGIIDPSRCIVTVHDAFFMKFEVPNFDYTSFRTLYPPFIQACRHIITCSENSKKDIIETMDVEESKISVIPWGIDHKNFFREENKNAILPLMESRLGLNRSFYLSVSCDDGRKRNPELIRGYLSLDHPANDLVLVWNRTPKHIEELTAGNPHIHILKNIKQEELRWVYNTATASINITSYEGFGLPILEAMACGCPVITCRNSSIPEVGGEAAVYIDEPINRTLPKILYDIEHDNIRLYENRTMMGLKQASLFTWEKTARATAKVYEEQLASLNII